MYFLIEATIALSVSFIINLFVMAVFGQAFYQQTNQDAVRQPSLVLYGTPGNAASCALSFCPYSGLGSSLLMLSMVERNIIHSACRSLLSI